MSRFLRVVMPFLMVLPICVYSGITSAEDLSKLSVIQNADSSGEPTRTQVTFLSVDGEIFYFSTPGKKVNVSPGNHKLLLTLISIDNFKIISTGRGSADCMTEAGYVYTVIATGCSKDGRRTDFEGSKEYWDKFDEDKKQKAEAVEAAKYQSDKFSLANAKSKIDILNVINSVEKKKLSGINRDDPDNLLGQAKQSLVPYLQAEAEENARLAAAREKEATRQAKEEEARKTKEQRQLVSFRKTIAEGDETNCGPVIESKGKLLKISFAVANYGNEHWVRRDEIFPSGYGCRFMNGQYQPPQ
ncbi:MAG: hypothetical protein WC208_01185 [Gallionella sp.]